MKKKLVAGTFWLTLANLVCKVIGVVYLIPWLLFMGDSQAQHQAQALYNIAYLPYALFLSLGTAGFPSGIARKIALADNPAQERKLFISALSVMEIIGVLSAILMFLFAPVLSQISPVTDQQSAIYAIRSLCPSLLLIPILSAIRGYFQGKNRLIPFGFSQVIEQVLRVIVILLGTYYLRRLTDGSILSAVAISTFASFIGGLGSISYLLVLGKKSQLFRLTDFLIIPVKHLKKSKGLAWGIIKESIPYVYVGSVISLAQLIDQVTLKPILYTFTHSITADDLQTLYTLSSTNPNKLTALLLSIVGSITVASLPLLSATKSSGERTKGVADTLRLSITILLPATIGMLILAGPLNTIFFGYDRQASIYLALAVISALIVGLFTVLLSIIQSLNHPRKAIIFTTRVLLVKLLGQIPLVYFFKGFGVSLATTLSFAIVTWQAYCFVAKQLDFSPLTYGRNYYLKLLINTTFMSILCVIMSYLLNDLFDPSNRLQAACIILIVASLGAGSFLVLQFGPKLKQLIFPLKR